MTHSVQDRLGWRLSPAEYEAIQALWIAHSKADDARNLGQRGQI